jgi:putative SOS response-associated peptidase YedK
MDARDSRVHNYPPRWNGAPSQYLLVIRRNHQRGQVSLDALRWGLIPYWCDDPKGGRKPINAKCEIVATLPTFREAYWRRRCIVPVDGFFEWKAVKGQKGYNMKLVSLICALSLLCPFAVHAQEANVKKVLNIYDTGSSADKQSIDSYHPYSRRRRYGLG